MCQTIRELYDLCVKLSACFNLAFLHAFIFWITPKQMFGLHFPESFMCLCWNLHKWDQTSQHSQRSLDYILPILALSQTLTEPLNPVCMIYTHALCI